MIKYKKPRGTKDIYGLEMDVMQYVSFWYLSKTWIYGN